MNIIFTASDLFAKPGVVMIDSLLRYNPGKHNIFFMFNSTSIKNRNIIKRTIEKYGSKYIEIFMDLKMFNGFPVYKRFGYELYFRLLMPYLLPSDIDRVLCIDSDMTINGSIKDIYNKDFFDNYLMAVPSPNDIQYKKINNTKQYIGGGFVIYNVKKIRNDFTKEYIVDYFLKNYDKYPYLDQDFVNCFYDGKIIILDGKYNYIIYRNKKYKKSDIYEISKNVIVAHFPGKLKPWNYLYGKNTYKIYWKEAKITLGILSYIKYKFLFYLFLPFQFIIVIMKKHRKSTFN